MQPDYSLALEGREDAGCNRLKPSDLLILIRGGLGDLTTAEKTMLLFFHVFAYAPKTALVKCRFLTFLIWGGWGVGDVITFLASVSR